MKMPRSIFIFALFQLVIKAYAQPSCTTYGEKDVVCTAGETDYVLRRGLVSDNNKTTGITLRGCRITDIDYEAFHQDDELRYIDLSVNKIERLKLGVMDGSHLVTYLNLSYNLFSTFPLGVFDAKPNMEVFDVKGNRINSLEVGVLDPFHKLVHLDLSSNSLLGRDIDPQLFRNQHEIKFMDFSRNDMSNSPENLLQALENIDFLNLDRCSLKEVPLFATRRNLKTMKHLMLSTNQISKIEEADTFTNLNSLEILNLAENEIENIAADIFKSLRKLKMVVFRNNKLKSLPDKLFWNMILVENVDFSYNLLEYVPPNAFTGTSIKILNLSHNKFSYLEADFYLQLKNSGVRMNEFYFNDNPWQCACLNEIIREMKNYGVNYNKDQYDGGNVVCVTGKHFACNRQLSDNGIFIEMYNRGK